MTEKFTFFWQNKSTFSQWHKSMFMENGQVFTCAEQYMMYHKAMLMGDIKTAQLILDAGYDPRKHKELGRQVTPFNAELWNDNCKEIVYRANYLKFTQNIEMLEVLKSTKGTELVEASPYDKIWGIGLLETDPRAQNKSTWQGKNWLGEVLTQLRMHLIGE
ncbi:GTP cyclohydrolase (plasmid) [Bacillus tropicus]|uniref:NADAR family protein n=1 Tax=Bacillus tropicus TaxID=2026188 RepID=UPI000A20B7C4|nr:GTP cyclohydrolase [Bacillus cereus]